MFGEPLNFFTKCIHAYVQPYDRQMFAGVLRGSAAAVETAGAPGPPLPADGGWRAAGGGAGEDLSAALLVRVCGSCSFLLMDLRRNCTCRPNIRQITV